MPDRGKPHARRQTVEESQQRRGQRTPTVRPCDCAHGEDHTGNPPKPKQRRRWFGR